MDTPLSRLDRPPRAETFDAQSLAEEFLAGTPTANIVATGPAWQRGLVPLSLEALMHVIELNGVAVAANHSAFSLGRLAAGDPAALDQLRAAPMQAQTQQADERPLEAMHRRCAPPSHRLPERRMGRTFRQAHPRTASGRIRAAPVLHAQRGA
ncbi:hypothetical protein J2W23_006254 [Variovorax boronicumulans]|nr:hypothetical protein [Variovorax boronicumulans]